ncbi:MAG: hypothetical protein AAF152_00460, partial [Cyanobacteria bacterium P01_A01_bin.114]
MKRPSLLTNLSQTDSNAAVPFQFRVNSFGLRLFLVIMGGVLVGIGGMAFLFGETVKYQAENQIENTLQNKVGTINDVIDQAETLAYGLNVSVSTLHVRQAETPETYQELTRQLFQGRPDFVTGLGFGQKAYGILPSRQWFFPYYQLAPAAQSSALSESQETELQPLETQADSLYIDQADPDYFYPATDRYRDYFLPRVNRWTTPYQSERGVLLTYYSQILDDQGEWLGTAMIDIDGTYLSTLLNEPVFQAGGQLMLLTADGDVIANPSNPSQLGTQTYEDIPGLSNIWRQLSSDTPGFIEGKTGYWAYTQIPERDWVVLAYVPYSLVFGRVMLITLGATTLVGLLLAGVVAGAIRHLNQRLRPMLAECHRLSEIDQAMVEQLKNKDELEQLSFSFFNLLDQLKVSQTKFHQEAAHAMAVEDQLKQIGAEAEVGQIRQQEAGQKLEEVEAQLSAMTAKAETSQMRQQEAGQKLEEVEAQLSAITAESEASRRHQQTLAQILEEMLRLAPADRGLTQEVAYLSEVASIFADRAWAPAEKARPLETDRLAQVLSQVSSRLGSTFARAGAGFTQFVELVPQLNRMTQQVRSLEQGIATTADEVQTQAQLTTQIKAWVETLDGLAQGLAQQAMTVDEVGQVAGRAFDTGQQKIRSMTSELEMFRKQTDQLADQIHTLFETTILAIQGVREHHRTANMARVLLLNASTLSIRASQRRDPEEFESIVSQFQHLGSQLQRLVVQFDQSLKQQQDQTGQVQAGGAHLRRHLKAVDQHMSRLATSIEGADQTLGQGQAAAHQLIRDDQQVGQLT